MLFLWLFLARTYHLIFSNRNAIECKVLSCKFRSWFLTNLGDKWTYKRQLFASCVVMPFGDLGNWEVGWGCPWNIFSWWHLTLVVTKWLAPALLLFCRSSINWLFKKSKIFSPGSAIISETLGWLWPCIDTRWVTLSMDRFARMPALFEEMSKTFWRPLMCNLLRRSPYWNDCEIWFVQYCFDWSAL